MIHGGQGSRDILKQFFKGQNYHPNKTYINMRVCWCMDTYMHASIALMQRD